MLPTAAGRKDILLLFLLCSALQRAGAVLLQHGAHQHKRNVNTLEGAQQRATEMTEGLKHLSYENRGRELGLFRLEREQLRRHHYKYLIKDSKAQLLPRTRKETMGTNKHEILPEQR